MFLCFSDSQHLKVRLLVVERLQGLPPLDAANCSSTTIGCSNSISQSATSWKASAPDHVLLPAEYDKVVAELKKRAEKGHMILALNEVCLLVISSSR
jgi:hypothetical protein